MQENTSPAASAEYGPPNTNQNDMADVIDSLKRLERVGSENSKTTEKLLAAARDLSRLITVQFVPADREAITVAETASGPQSTRPIRYVVHGGKSTKEDHLSRDNVFVAENRDAALAFSKDVADGLLDLISETLTRRTQESQAGLDTLGHAIENLRKNTSS